MSTPSSEELARVEAALRQGQKIEAIKLYRECTGAGLAEAKTAVEAMESQRPTGSSTPLKDGATLGEIETALFRGEKIQAIIRYRQVTGAGLAEAKTAVEKLEAELRTKSPDKFTVAPAGKGCLGVVALLCLILLTLVAWKAGS